jgi:hypothetical protein
MGGPVGNDDPRATYPALYLLPISDLVSDKLSE